MIKICMTMYNPSFSQIENVSEVSACADKVFICDNSTKDNSTFFCNMGNVIYDTRFSNDGISKAFNRVLKNTSYGWDSGDYILFLDQDSKINRDVVDSLKRELEMLSESLPVGIVGPVRSINEKLNGNSIQMSGGGYL